MFSKGDPLPFIRGLGRGVPKTKCSSSRVGQIVGPQVAVVGTGAALCHRNPFFFGQEDAALYRHLGTLLRHCVMVAAAGERTEEFHG